MYAEETLSLSKQSLLQTFPYKIGDTIKINVPMEIKWEVKDFEIVGIYPDYVLLTDGIINVCWDIATIYYMKKGDVLKGEWT